MMHFTIPVFVKRKAMVNVAGVNLEDAMTQIKVLGNNNKVTGVSGQNEDVEINYKEIGIYNPRHNVPDKFWLHEEGELVEERNKEDQ